MKSITIKRLTINNFKGIFHLVINFDRVTNIYGANGSGKTTVFDAFLWVLFGKDSTDRKDFEVKTLDENNQPYHRLDHEVQADLVVDGEEIAVKRCMKEKWTKKRGSSIEEMTNHDNTYYWNDVPLKLEDYKAKIAGIVDENIFKLLTNTTYFNSLKWQDRRSVLMQIAGTTSDAELVAKVSSENRERSFTLLTNALNAKKSIKEFKDELSAKKKKIKDELDTLPSRINEANRSLGLLPEVDEKEISSLIAIAEQSIGNIDKKLMSQSDNEKALQDEKVDLQRRIGTLKGAIAEREHEIRQAVVSRRQARKEKIVIEKGHLNEKNNQYSSVSRELRNLSESREKYVQKQSNLRQEWHKTNDAVLPPFDESSCACPTCQLVFDDVNVEEKRREFENNFNADKTRKLAEIKDRGTALGNEIAELEQKIEALTARSRNLQDEIKVISERINSLTVQDTRLNSEEEQLIAKDIASDLTIVGLKTDIENLQAEIDKPADNSDAEAEKARLIARKQELNREIARMREELGSVKSRDSLKKRIQELTESESQMNQELADLEQSEYSIELFNRAKMNELADRVNRRFKYVQFKMFEEQLNGGQSETCETLINGVPFQDANTASKINAGLDIINVLSEHYNVSAPIFIDNRESVTDLIDTDAQLINLFVSPEHPKLTVKNASAKAEQLSLV